MNVAQSSELPAIECGFITGAAECMLALNNLAPYNLVCYCHSKPRRMSLGFPIFGVGVKPVMYS